MCAALGDISVLEHNDDVGVVNGAQAVCDEDAGAFFFFDERVDV
jgi:hypothetical protein